MPNYAALRAALANYPGQTDDQIAAALNTPVATPVDTPIGQVLNILLTAGEWPKVVQQAKGTGTDPATLTAVQATELAAQQGRDADPISTSQPATLAIWNGALAELRAANLISAGSVTAIQALATAMIAPATTMGFAQVTDSEIAAARLV